MTYMITGATGYIGSVLLGQLLEEGHTAHVLHRPSSAHKVDQAHPRIVPFAGDLLDRSSLERAAKGCEGIFHLAAYASVWAPDPSTFHEVNVTGTRNVLHAAGEAYVSRVVVTSTAGILPASGDGEPVDEASSGQRLDTEYARSKYQAVRETQAYLRKGVSSVVVYPPRIYGPGPRTESNAVTRLVRWYLQGWWRFVPGDGHWIGNYAYVEDVARGMRLAMSRGEPGEGYILGGENLSLRELLDLVGEVSGRRRRLWGLPLPLLRTLARVEQWRADHLSGRPLITPDWLDNYMKHAALSSRKAVEELGYEITPVREGLRRTVRWLQGPQDGPES